MINFPQLLAVIMAGVSVGIADSLIKRIALTGSFWSALKSPWMAVVLLLILVQVSFFIFVFRRHWDLGIAGSIHIVFYALTILLAGLFIFGENISLTQGIGIGLALVGVVLMNI